MVKSFIPSDYQKVFDAAVSYCARRETSRLKLELYLSYKFLQPIEDESTRQQVLGWIQKSLDECERFKVVDHERFADMLSRDYSRRGKGRHYVEQKLIEKGLDQQLSKLEFSEENELQKARELVEKTLQRGSIQKIEDLQVKRQKLLQRLISQGFELSVAKKAIELAEKGE